LGLPFWNTPNVAIAAAPRAIALNVPRSVAWLTGVPLARTRRSRLGGEDSEFDTDWGTSQSGNYKIELDSSQKCEQFCHEDAG
jgi:hypothetical protein